MKAETLDRDAIARLAKALVFICGSAHPATVACQAAAGTGSENDLKKARSMFLKLRPGERKAALIMLAE